MVTLLCCKQASNNSSEIFRYFLYELTSLENSAEYILIKLTVSFFKINCLYFLNPLKSAVNISSNCWLRKAVSHIKTGLFTCLLVSLNFLNRASAVL